MEPNAIGLGQSLKYRHHVKGGGLKSLAVVGIASVTDSQVYGRQRCEMTLIDDIRGMAASIDAELKEKKGAYMLTFVVAERKASLSKKKLEYIARFRVDDVAREFKFTEMLKETGSGVSGGGDDISPGFGFKVQTYKTGAGPREGSITEQSNYFGKQYSYSYDWSAIRTWIEQAAQASGYSFSYSITGWKI